MKPLIKWVGGKTQALPYLTTRIPDDFDTYIEPMCGGAALFWHLHGAGRLKGKISVLGDINRAVIDLYAAVRDDPEEISRELGDLAMRYPSGPSELYYLVRDEWNAGMTSPGRFIFLKQTSFNGLWRENSKGEINMPWGKYATPAFPDLASLKAYSSALQGVTLSYEGYEMTLQEHTKPGSFVYFDPPYYRAFDQYNAKGFNKAMHRQLIIDCGRYTRAGVNVLYSNRYYQQLTDWVAQYWRGASMQVVESRTSISCQSDGRKKELDIMAWS